MKKDRLIITIGREYGSGGKIIGEKFVRVFERYARCGLLVLDDLGKGSKTDWAVERIYMLLDYRYNHKLPTIITSNYDIGEVAALLSTDEQSQEAIASRIGGMCRGVRMSGKDRRLARNPK